MQQFIILTIRWIRESLWADLPFNSKREKGREGYKLWNMGGKQPLCCLFVKILTDRKKVKFYTKINLEFF